MKTTRPTDSNILLKAMADEIRNSGIYNFIWALWDNSTTRSTASFETGFSEILRQWYKDVKKEFQEKVSQM